MSDSDTSSEHNVQKIKPGDDLAEGRDLAEQNRRKLAELFPSVLTETLDDDGNAVAAVDANVLRDLVGATVDTGIREKFGLSWHGKGAARRLALTPSTGTLRPARDESLDWATTQNTVIEGDNLEVLKLLQKSYAGCVKLIYIDPPYNTGNDFVYKDNFRDPIGQYQRLTKQRGEKGEKLTSSPETAGRFHTQWLNMIYPRLLLARELLSDEGAIFVSIDDGEIHHLREVMDSVFGEENAVATLSVLNNPRGRAQDKHFATNHDYVVCYTRRPLEKGSFEIPKPDEQVEREYPDSDAGGRYRLLELRNTHRQFGKHNRPNLFYPLYVDNNGAVSVDPKANTSKVLPIWNDGFEGCWTWGKPKASEQCHLLQGRIVHGEYKVYVKDYAKGARRMLKTMLYDNTYSTDNGQRSFNELFDTKEKIFQSPKSPRLLADLIATRARTDDIVLDFFAGSGSAGHAVMAQNAADGENRRYVLVQLPEPTGRADYATITGLMKERLRRAGAKIKKDYPDWRGDTGFRVFKLDTANVKAWEAPTTDDLGPERAANLIRESVDAVKPDRSEADLLWGAMLNLGLRLDGSIEQHEVAGQTVYVAGAGTLLACFSDAIDRDTGEALAEGMAEIVNALSVQALVTVLLRDTAFDGRDAVKANLIENLRQRMPDGASIRALSI